MNSQRSIPLEEAVAARKAVHMALGDPMMLMRIRTERIGTWKTATAELRFHVPATDREKARKAAEEALEAVQKPVRVMIFGPGDRLLASRA